MVVDAHYHQIILQHITFTQLKTYSFVWISWYFLIVIVCYKVAWDEDVDALELNATFFHATIMTCWNRKSNWHTDRNNWTYTQCPYAHAHRLKTHMQREKWKPAGQHSLIWDIQISSLHSRHICPKLHLWSISATLHLHLAISSMIEPPSNLNNNPIS